MVLGGVLVPSERGEVRVRVEWSNLLTKIYTRRGGKGQDEESTEAGTSTNDDSHVVDRKKEVAGLGEYPHIVETVTGE